MAAPTVRIPHIQRNLRIAQSDTLPIDADGRSPGGGFRRFPRWPKFFLVFGQQLFYLLPDRVGVGIPFRKALEKGFLEVLEHGAVGARPKKHTADNVDRSGSSSQFCWYWGGLHDPPTPAPTDSWGPIPSGYPTKSTSRKESTVNWGSVGVKLSQ